MNKKIRNYYLGLLAMFGEIISQKTQESAPAAPTTAGDELRRMIKERLIRYHKHIDGKRTFRICDPGGYAAIRELDDRLLQHAEALTGKKGARYTGSQEYRLKKRKEAELMEVLLKGGMTVDGVVLRPDGELDILAEDITSPVEILSRAPDTPQFISGSVLKGKNSRLTHQRREMSTMTGAIFSKAGTFITYSISTARFRWYASAETSAANNITRLYEEAKDIERHRDGRFRSIIYASSVSVASELIASTGKGSQKMDPTRIFRLTYIVPFEDKSLALDVTKMLQIPDWRKKTNEVLGLSPSDKYDGVTSDGRRIHNLLCCNLSKLHDISGDIKRGNCKLVVNDWMEPVLRELYATEVEMVSLSPKHFRGLLLTLIEKEENARL